MQRPPGSDFRDCLPLKMATLCVVMGRHVSRDVSAYLVLSSHNAIRPKNIKK